MWLLMHHAHSKNYQNYSNNYAGIAGTTQQMCTISGELISVATVAMLKFYFCISLPLPVPLGQQVFVDDYVPTSLS